MADDPDATQRAPEAQGGASPGGGADSRPSPSAGPAAFDADATLRAAPREMELALAEGQRVFGRYVLEAEVGRGGMGVVWRARDEELGETVALKFLPAAVARDAAAVDELKEETRRARRLTHPNIVRIHDFVRDATLAAVSMELVDGQTLSDLRIAQPGKIFSVTALAPIVSQLGAALDYAHGTAKIVHRDLKPANILVTAEGAVKITDFGIARSLTESTTRLTGKVGDTSGTLPYMSPQQVLGRKPTPADDLYALGATLYELLTSKPPFHRGDPHSLMLQVQQRTPLTLAEQRDELEVVGAEIPATWERAILECLAKEPNGRPASAGAVAAKLGLAGPAMIAVASTAPSAVVDTLSSERSTREVAAEGARCPSCGKSNRETARHCVQCGKDLTEACGECSERNRIGSRFCEGCGVDLPGLKNLPAALAKAERLLEEKQAVAARVVLQETTAIAGKLKPEGKSGLGRRLAELTSRVATAADEQVVEEAIGQTERLREEGKLAEAAELLRSKASGVMGFSLKPGEKTGLAERYEALRTQLQLALDQEQQQREAGAALRARALEREGAGKWIEALAVWREAGKVVGVESVRAWRADPGRHLRLREEAQRVTAAGQWQPAAELWTEIAELETDAGARAAAEEQARTCVQRDEESRAAIAATRARRVLVAMFAALGGIAVMAGYWLGVYLPAEHAREESVRIAQQRIEQARLAELERAELARRAEADRVRAELEQRAARLWPEQLRLRESGQAWAIPDLGLTLLPIAAGTFAMGRENGEEAEGPVTRVTLTQSFWLGKTEVTQREWAAVMGSNPSKFKGDTLPVEQVSWEDAMAFCRKLTERERTADRLPARYAYTLPTEAQWEYACRAGTTGDYSGELGGMGWYDRNSGNTPHAVATKRANAWGLHDMHGNVWEWCADWSADKLSGGTALDPKGPASGTHRVYRGGSWGNVGSSARSARRGGSGPGNRSNLGFRVALSFSP